MMDTLVFPPWETQNPSLPMVSEEEGKAYLRAKMDIEVADLKPHIISNLVMFLVLCGVPVKLTRRYVQAYIQSRLWPFSPTPPLLYVSLDMPLKKLTGWLGILQKCPTQKYVEGYPCVRGCTLGTGGRRSTSLIRIFFIE